MKNLNTTSGGFVFSSSSNLLSDDYGSFDIPVWDGLDDLEDINVFVILE